MSTEIRAALISPLILVRPILLIPDFSDVVDFFGFTIHYGVTMFCTNDELIIITLNICGCTGMRSINLIDHFNIQGNADLTAVPKSYDVREEDPLARSTMCSFSLTMSTKRRLLVLVS